MTREEHLAMQCGFPSVEEARAKMGIEFERMVIRDIVDRITAIPYPMTIDVTATPVDDVKRIEDEEEHGSTSQ